MSADFKRCLSGLTSLFFCLLLSGCLGTKTTGGSTTGSPAAPAVRSLNLSRIPEPWKGPAGKLSQRGFSQEQLEAVFRSPNLNYTSGPMAAKLKELYPIYFRSDLIKEIQEKLFQLGYEIRIDGRGGPDTKDAIIKFQTDRHLGRDGQVSPATLAAVNRAMKGRALRPLSEYSPPPARKASRTATHTQFTNAAALAKIKGLYQADREIFQRMSREYNVPGELAAAIMWVETRYGEFLGRYKAADMLASMAAAASDFSVVQAAVSDLDKDRESRRFLEETAVRRGDWALNELAALMTYSFRNGHDLTAFPSSIFGAVGWGQFMPSNVLKYGVDGNRDGRVDLFDKTDAIFSIGHFLKSHGWTGGRMSEEQRRAVVMKYNKSGIYVNTVLYVADYLAKNK
ncbi:MAG: lytic murein transglycosylase [Candidatus Adiutrix sp.]|jgi:membrane-bound lytic murein transglycosylase B|nr:lytic murein transglycosylase [Candidatus Adiutrix sp.]